ncbi:5-amino-6-(5-phosphoribosylamino)uracil reductase [Streptomyces sp. LaPpAH-199]|nr:5-amino-6-(5-phosphoribosylamino)uracil reductase [Streptomyces sp. LaPpAH-199]
MPRPYVLLSAAVSIDGHLDTRPGEARLMLSNKEDFDRVDSVRASVDAILLGAATLRADNPRLLVNSEDRRASRIAAGQPEYPLKVTITGTGDLDPNWKFWHHGGDKLVLAVGDTAAAKAHSNLGDLATVQSIPAKGTWPAVLDVLGDVYAVKRLMVEGGGTIHTQLLEAGIADELQLVIAPLLVGQPDAVRMLGSANYPGGPTSRLRLLEARQIGDVVLLRYAPKDTSTEAR